MEAPFTPTMASSPFYFYSPDSQQDRHYAPFSPCPSLPAGMPFYPQIVKNPGVNYTTQYPMPDASTIFQQAIFPQRMPTPAASPQPSQQQAKAGRGPLRQLDTDFGPSTPPLSASGSASSSPPTAYPSLATPLMQSFALPDSIYGSKFDLELFGDALPSNEWMSPSPPHTPVFSFPSIDPTQCPATETETKVKLPDSISPSSLPLSLQTEPDPALSFCDPRQLTVHSPTLLPTPITASSQNFKSWDLTNNVTFDVPQLPSDDSLGATALRNCDTLFSLGFDPEFSTFSKSGLADVNYFTNQKRQRTQLASFIPDEDPFVSEDSFSDVGEDQLACAWLSTPSELDSSFHSDMSSSSPTSTQDFNSHEAVEVDSEADYKTNGAGETSNDNASTEEQTSAGNAEEEQSPMPSASKQGSGDDQPGSIRRGRKQSLTDDPSKTFVCHLCNRRFRRQEHLKRHYRSLHTHDKPFKCADCGKQFSRSDNLAQHQRTHGVSIEAGGDEVENPEAGASPESDTDRMAQILYQAAQKLAQTTSESSGSSTEESEGSVSRPTPEKKRKRKRVE